MPVRPAITPLFQTDSLGGGPSPLSVVPPTPVTNGWLDGSSTASDKSGMLGSGPLQSSEPSSPDAETIDWPWAAASWNNVLSACRPSELDGSHSPHETDITFARFCVMIALNVS